MKRGNKEEEEGEERRREKDEGEEERQQRSRREKEVNLITSEDEMEGKEGGEDDREEREVLGREKEGKDVGSGSGRRWWTRVWGKKRVGEGGRGAQLQDLEPGQERNEKGQGARGDATEFRRGSLQAGWDVTVGRAI